MYLLLSSRYFTFFFFKQKTAYEMRISDWSSDVCSSDLCPASRRRPCSNICPTTLCCSSTKATRRSRRSVRCRRAKIGRASCRERLCPYLSISLVGVPFTNTAPTENQDLNPQAASDYLHITLHL